MAYVYQPYPRTLFRGSETCIVQNYGEEKAHKEQGWGNTPGYVAPEPESELEPVYVVADIPENRPSVPVVPASPTSHPTLDALRDAIFGRTERVQAETSSDVTAPKRGRGRPRKVSS